MTTDNYFTAASGRRYTYAEIADRIRGEAPHTLGEHIFVQLEAIGLLEEFRNGSTPCGLAYTFAEKPHPIRKQLTSSGLVHTPGLFRALQNDYRIQGATRRRAIRIFRDGYGLSREEAEGLLSGAITSEIDDAAGTITFASRCEEPPVGSDAGKKPYSVLMLYPDYVNDGSMETLETYYAFVDASGPIEAVALAQRQAAAAQEGVEIEPEDFAPLLVTQGHHYGQPLFNK
ncbi:MAG: hypothetical protein ACJ8AW_30735 [Rhodopila sp.]